MGCSASKIANIPARAGSTSGRKIPPYRIWPLRCKTEEIISTHISKENINYSNDDSHMSKRELLTVDDHESKSASNDVFLDAGDCPLEDINDDHNNNNKNKLSTIVQKEKGLPENKKKNNNGGGQDHPPDDIENNDKDWFPRSPSFKVYVRLPSLNADRAKTEEEEGASESNSSSNRPQIQSSASGSSGGGAGADPSASSSTVVLHDNNEAVDDNSSSSSSFSSSSSLPLDNINKKKKMEKSSSNASSIDSIKSSRRSSISSSGRRSLNRLLLSPARGKISAMKNYVHAVAACRTLRTTSRQTTRHHKL